ncbi:MAG: hypothetical protein ILO42_02865 [Clostridia bacterium]|nr:hypothetical protein [Clostridia bacterium]
MKSVRKILSVLLAAVFVLLPLTVAPPAAADGESASGAEIVGIDYGRITQKAGKEKRNYPVELKLGDVTFNGELVGEVGLTIEDLNAVIRQTLADHELTPERVALVKKIAERVQTDAGLYWGDQVVSGLLSYLPIPGTVFSFGDVYDFAVHGDLDSAKFSAEKGAAQEAAKAGLNAAKNAGGRVGRVGRKVAGAVKQVPLLGQIVNTAIVANNWLDGSKYFDAYLELLEENLEIINNFYSACGRRAAELAESRNLETSWKIRFDKNKNYRTYNCTFWGISGNMMSVVLSGTLNNNSGGVEGAYSGTLWLEFSAVDFSPVESGLEKTPGLNVYTSLLYSTGGYKKTSDTGGKTVLNCESQGQLTFYVSKTEGALKPNVVGDLSADRDIRFSFNRRLEWHDESHAALGAHGVTEATATSTDIDSIRMKTSSRVYSDNGTGISNDTDETFSQDHGTVLAPLDSAPVVTIYFTK